MAAHISQTTRKISLDLSEGTQTISPILETATDEAIYETGLAIGTLQAERLEAINLVTTEVISE